MIDVEFLYTAMIKGLLSDKNYAITVTSVFEPEYFEDQSMISVFNMLKNHLEKHNTIPEKDIILNTIPKDDVDGVTTLFNDAEATDFSVASNYDWLRDETNKYLKERAIKQSIIQSVDVIDHDGDYDDIKKLVEAALCKDINIDLGLDYFGDMKERLKRIFSASDNRVRTYYPTLDELFNGGFPPYTLNMMIAKVHGHKCVCHDTYIDIRDNNTKEPKKIKIGDFYKHFYDREHKGEVKMTKNNSLGGVSKLILFQNKYGTDEGQKWYDVWMEKNRQNGRKKGRGTLQWYIDKYGTDEGQKRYDEKCHNIRNSTKGINSLPWFQNKYGTDEGQKRYDEKCHKSSDKGRCTLPWFQNKYGADEGQKRYDGYISKQKHSCSCKGYIDKYGVEEGIVRWNQRCVNISKRGTLEGYIDKYGVEEGQKRYDERQSLWQNTMKSKAPEEIQRIIRERISNGRYNGYSVVSQELFSILYDEIKRDFDNIRFAILCDGVIHNTGYNNEQFLSFGDRNMFVDFYVGDNRKIIEFDGDYWHGEARGNKQLDNDRDTLLEQNGYTVLRIKERDYNNDCDGTIKLCLDFIYG